MATASAADDTAVANVKNNRERSVADLRRGPRRSDRATPKRFQLLTRAAAGAILLFASTAHRPARSSHNPDPSRAGPEPWLGGSAPWCYNPWNSGYTAGSMHPGRARRGSGQPAGAEWACSRQPGRSPARPSPHATSPGNRQDQPRHDQPHRAQPGRGRPRPSRPRVEAIPDDYPRETI